MPHQWFQDERWYDLIVIPGRGRIDAGRDGWSQPPSSALGMPLIGGSLSSYRFLAK